MRSSMLVTGLMLVCTACNPNPTTASFNEREWALIQTLELSETLPVDHFNPFTDNQLPQIEAQAVTLGQQLFFDRGLSGGDAGLWFDPDAGDTGDGGPDAGDGGRPGRWFVGNTGVSFDSDAGMSAGLGGAGIACADCHSPQGWFSDPRTPREVSVGVGLTTRNSPGLVDVSNYQVFSWDGRGETLRNQCIIAYQSSRTMAGTSLKVWRRLMAVPAYRAAYDSLFPNTPLTTAPDGGVPSKEVLDGVLGNTALLWASYVRALQSHDAAFDRFVRGDPLALTAAQQRGLKLFIGNAGCIECHNGPMFSDSRMHVTGVGQTSPGAPMVDTGRADALVFLATFEFALGRPPPPTAADFGAFRTKSLRHVTETGPYFHAGQYATLRDVIWFYVRGGDHAGSGTPSTFMQPLGLSDDEQADLEAFLHSLTGLPPDDSLRCDPSWSTTALLVDGGIGLRPRTPDAGAFPLCPGVAP